MRKLWAAATVVAMLAIAAIVLVGWDIARDRHAPTPAAIPTVAATSSPIRSVTPPPIATPASLGPGPATLASGADVQNGRHGYTSWCASDAAGACVISERYGGPVPFETLRVPPGGTLAFAYRGPESLTAISSLVYSLVGTGSGEYPTLRGGISLPTMQTDHQATITAPVSLGEYVIIVRISGANNTTADFQFHVLVA